MKEHRISVEIDHDGRITAEADGFSGDACLRDLEKLLGGLGEWEIVEHKADAGDRANTPRRTTHIGKERP